MKKGRLAAQARSHLDGRLKEFRPVSRFTPPAKGWIRAIREALGMTAEQLATRLGVKQPTLHELERSEVKSSIQLGTLRRVATALDCTLVYAFVPNQSLEATVRARARSFIRRRLAPVAHSMMLEDQKVEDKPNENHVDEVLRETSPSKLWE